MFVCADGLVCEYADDGDAVAAACDVARHHARVGIASDARTAQHCAARALPGMVICPRRFEAAFTSYPLTSTTALVEVRAR